MTFETDDNVDTGATENTAAEVETEQTNTATDSESQESENIQTDEPEKEVEQEKPKRNRAQEQIQQLARENAELKQWRAQQEAQANAPKPSQKPKIDDFETYDEYEEKLEEWRIEEATRRLEERQNKTFQEKTQYQKAAEYESAIAELASEGVDVEHYSKKLEKLPPLPVTLDQFGLSTKESLVLAQKLLDNDELYIELSQMNPIQAAVKIGQFISSSTEKKAPPVSKAPPPIKPVQANAPARRDYFSQSDDEIMRGKGI